MASFGELIFGILMLVVGSITYGWGLSVIWNWYMPNLFGSPSLTIAQAIGISMVIKMLVGTSSGTKDETKSFSERMLRTTLESVFMIIIFVGFAWIVRYWAF